MENKKEKPAISVIMSVYKEKSDFLMSAINSILCQSFNDFEFIIIDDDTSPENLKLIEGLQKNDNRIIVLSNEKNLGLTASLNRGLAIANGKYIARIDSDDIADKSRLEKQFHFLEKNSEYALCGSWAKLMNEKNEVIGEKKFYTSYEEIKKKILYFNFFTHSSLFFKKNAALEVGGYSEKIKKAQDYDLILKISAKYPIANIPEFLCYHRTHSKSISEKGKKKQEWYALISRLRAIFLYGYPKNHFWKILPAILYFLLIPIFLEKIIIKRLEKNAIHNHVENL